MQKRTTVTFAVQVAACAKGMLGYLRIFKEVALSSRNPGRTAMGLLGAFKAWFPLLPFCRAMLCLCPVVKALVLQL